MKISMLDPKKLKPYKRNAKGHTDEQIDLLAKMIGEDGFDQPVVVDAKGVIIKGHGRVLASLKLGLDEIPCVVSTLDDVENNLSRAVDNESVDTEWDNIALGLELRGLTELGGNLSDTLLVNMDMDALSGLPLAPSKIAKSDLAKRETTHECASCGYKW